MHTNQYSSIKKVVLLCDFFSSLGGTENYNAALARGLQELGIEVRIYVGEKPRLLSWKTQLISEGLFFKEPLAYHKDLATNNIEMAFVNEVVDEINDWNPDIIHVHPFRKMAIQWLTNKKANHSIPLVVTEWTVPNKNAAHWFENNTSEYINRVHAYIATCHAITKGVRDYHHYNGSIVEIPHIIKNIPTNILPHTEASLSSIGCISRLSTEKGLVFLIGAWRQVIDIFPGQKLHIYGHGPERKSLELLRDCLGLHDAIIFSGTYKPGEISSVAKRHSVFVQPSLFESIPTSIIELMVNGRVIIASNVGGISELVKNNRNGIIVKPGSTDEIAKAIITLLSSPDKIMLFSQAAYRDSHATYNYNETMMRIVNLYETVITK